MPDTQETPTQQAHRLLDKHKDACIARGVADHRYFAPVGRAYHDEKVAVIGDALLALVERLDADRARLRSALLGYHKAASAIPFAQWSTEQHAAEIALEENKR